MDEIEQRLRENSERTIKAYEAWVKSEKDGKSTEELQEAVHELRKVASRLEIEMAISERAEMASRPLPVPPHRASKGRNKQRNNHNNEPNNNEKKETPVSTSPAVETKPQRRRIVKKVNPE